MRHYIYARGGLIETDVGEIAEFVRDRQPLMKRHKDDRNKICRRIFFGYPKTGPIKDPVYRQLNSPIPEQDVNSVKIPKIHSIHPITDNYSQCTT